MAVFQLAQTDSGYSLNLVSVTADGASNNTRGWRVNVTTTASQTQGDLQGIHTYLTTGSSVTLGTNAAVYGLSAWVDIPSDITLGSGHVIAGERIIFDGNGVDFTGMAGGGESALLYMQTWGGVATQLDFGVRVVAGASTTIDSAFSAGGSGTIGDIIDLTDWEKDTLLRLVLGGPKDGNEDSHWTFCVGDKDSDGDIATEVGAASDGSLYVSTAGNLYLNVSGTWTALATA